MGSASNCVGEQELEAVKMAGFGINRVNEDSRIKLWI